MNLLDARDSQDRTPLMLAVQNESEGRKRSTDILLEYASLVDLCDKNGRTALHYASCRGFEDCVTSLLDAKASPYQKDYLGKTPFHLAAAAGHVNVLKQLMPQDNEPLVDLKLPDNQHCTPLHWAAYKGKIKRNHSVGFNPNCNCECLTDHRSRELCRSVVDA